MRMTASWFRSPRINRIQGRGAISAPDGELPSDLSPAAPRAGQFDHQQSLPVRPGTAKKGRGSERGDGCQLGQTRRLDKHRPIQGFRMPAITDAAQMHWGRRPKASREGTRGMIGRSACGLSWGFAAPPGPGDRIDAIAQASGVAAGGRSGASAPCRVGRDDDQRMLHPRVMRPVRPSARAARRRTSDPAADGGGLGGGAIRFMRCRSDHGRRVRGRCAGEGPRANCSMMIMRPPQQGQRCLVPGGAVAPAVSVPPRSASGSAHSEQRAGSREVRLAAGGGERP